MLVAVTTPTRVRRDPSPHASPCDVRERYVRLRFHYKPPHLVVAVVHSEPVGERRLAWLFVPILGPDDPVLRVRKSIS